MPDTPQAMPAMLALVHARKCAGGRNPLPETSLPRPLDMLLVVTRSASDRWLPGKAYFTAFDADGPERADLERGRAEGYLFLAERRTGARAGEASPLPAAPSWIRLCENAVACANSADALERYRGHIYFHELLYEYYRASDRREQGARAAVELTKAHIDSHYAEEMTIEGLASMADVSPSYYMELFKQIAGTSPIDYLTSVRIDAARRLLDDTGAPAHQVAQSVGYRDPFYFSRQFKKVTGLSPSRYVRRSARRIVSFHYPMTGQMLALQNIPYAAPLDREFCLFYKRQYERHIPVHLRDPSVEANMAYNLELLRETRPDVVIAGDWLPEAQRDELSRIAPTLYVPWWEKSWREHLLIVARYLGETAQAERWLDKYETQAAKARARLQGMIGESSVMAIHVLQGQIHRFGSRNLGAVLYGDLQIRPAGQPLAAQAYEPLAVNELLALNPDRVLAAVGSDPLSQQLWAGMSRRPEWRELASVRNRRVYPIQPDPWFDYSAMGHERILKEIVKLFSSDRPS